MIATSCVHCEVFTYTNSDSGSEDVGMVYEGSAAKTNGSSQYDDDVCRDYMRNVCTRGKRCRYRHPVEEQQQQQQPPEHPPARRDITFCHDYQNNGCTRPHCKFLHCSRDEEEWFHRTGLLPVRLNHPSQQSSSLQRAETPLCKDYMNGDCKRGSKCRYRHKSEHGDRGDHDRSEFKICKDYLNSDCKRGSKCKYRHMNDHDLDRGGRDLKRRRLDDGDYDRDHSDLSFSYLEEENDTLKKKVEELKKQVSDMTAINEVLLEQNARYRVSKAAAMQVPVSQQTLTALAMASSPVPASAVAPSPVHVQPTLSQLNSSLSTQHAMQTAQRIAAGGNMSLTGGNMSLTGGNMSLTGGNMSLTGGNMSLTAQQAPTMAAPTLTPTVTITQNIAGALALTQSNLHVSMAQMSQQPQLQVAHSLTQNLGAPSTSLVSYPIMSQNMRSAIEHSSLAHSH